MKNIVLGLGALGAGAYTITRGGVFQGDEEENNEVITGQFPGQGAGVGGSPIKSGQAPGPSVNIEAPDVQPMDLEGLESGFSSKKEKESSESSSSDSSSSSSSLSKTDIAPNLDKSDENPRDKDGKVKKDVIAPNLSNEEKESSESETKKEEQAENPFDHTDSEGGGLKGSIF